MKGWQQSQQQKNSVPKTKKKMFQFSMPVWFVSSLDEIGTVFLEKKILEFRQFIFGISLLSTCIERYYDSSFEQT